MTQASVQSVRTSNRSRRLWLFSIAVVVALGGVLAWVLTRPEGFLVGLWAIDDTRAVALIRYNDEDRSEAWVTVVDRDGALIWDHELSGLPVTASYDGMSLGSDSISVRSETEGDDHITEVFSLRDGKRRWDAMLGQSGSYIPAFATAGNDSVVIELVRDANGQETVIALDRATGTQRWRWAMTDSTVRPHLEADTLILEDLFMVELLALSNGHRRAQETRGAGCVIGDHYYAISGSSVDPELVRFDLRSQAPAERIGQISVPTLAVAQRDHLSVERCGTYDGQLIVTVARAQTERSEGLELWAIDPNTAQVRWQLDLGPVAIAITPRTVAYRDGLALSGPLSRYPFVILWDYSGEPAGAHTHVAVLDLVEHTIVRRSRQDHELIYFSLLCRGSRCYMTGTEGRIAALDTETGTVTAAVRVPDLGFDDTEPYHLSDGALWVHTGKWSKLSEQPVVALDPETLEPTGTGQSRVTITRAPEFVEWLGL